LIEFFVMPQPALKYVRKFLRIRNPNDRAIEVLLEPWAERHQLNSMESLEIVFVGPDTDHPAVLPQGDEIAVYGWKESDAIVLKNGEIASPRPTVEEIVKQELNAAKQNEQLAIKVALPVEDIEWIQRSLDELPESGQESQLATCELAAFLAHRLAESLEQSMPTAELIWSIIGRFVKARGIILEDEELDKVASAAWSDGPNRLKRLVENRAISVFTGSDRLISSKRANKSPKQRRDESQFRQGSS
jgi:hypothetical protein